MSKLGALTVVRNYLMVEVVVQPVLLAERPHLGAGKQAKNRFMSR
jgi:hypothetical protein